MAGAKAKTGKTTLRSLVTGLLVVMAAAGVATGALAAASPLAGSSVSASEEPSDGSVVQRHLVTFASGVTAAEQVEAIQAAGADDVSSIAPLRMHVVAAGLAAVDALKADARVSSVETEAVRVAEGDPDDARYGEQWSLPRIGWNDVYGTLTPEGSATVAILDTGVDAAHPDLAGRVLPGTSILDDSDGRADPNGHGTAMGGIVAANTNNGIGVAGVGYAGVDVLPVTVLGADGTGQDGDIIEGVVYAADHGADVILMAFSNAGYSASLQAAVDYAWSKGAVLVAAAGNDGSSTPTFPAGDRGVIGVANTDVMDSLNLTSNYGDSVFLAAPGTGIETTSAGGGYATITGTSAAAAEVAGAAALLRADDAMSSNGTIVGRLARNADPAGTSFQTGNGRVNLARAIVDTDTTAIQPSGAAPLGDGGPLVGPYVAAAPRVGSVNVGTQNPSVVTAGKDAAAFSTATSKTATYTVTVNRGSGPGSSGSFTTNLTIDGSLPAGVTASFSPASLSFANSETSKTSTLTLATTDATLAGSASFVVKGVRSDNSNDSATGSGQLAVKRAAAFGGAGYGTFVAKDTVIPISTSVRDAAFVFGGTQSANASRPTGALSFASNRSGTFTNGGSCSLVADANPVSSNCQLQYTPSEYGTHNVTISYGGSATHNGGQIFVLEIVVGHATTTSVECTPNPVTPTGTSTCTATVSDVTGAGASAPTGTVRFHRQTGAGYVITPCTLVPLNATQSSCGVSYAGADLQDGNNLVWPIYDGSTNGGPFAASNVTTYLVRSSATQLGVSAASGTYGGTTTLSASLTSAGSAVANRSVSFKLNGTSVGSATTNATGVATLSNVSLGTIGAGSYPSGTTASFGGDSSYTSSTGSANLTVSKAVLSANAIAASKLYGGADPAFGSTLSGFKNGETEAGLRAASPAKLTGAPSCTRGSGEGVATYTITCAPGTLAADNYTFQTGNTAAFSIDKAQLTVNAVAASKTYGADDPIFSWTYSGFVNGENATSAGITGNASCSRTAGETFAGSPYTITCAPGNLSAANYSFAAGDTASFTIGKKTFTVSGVTASNKVYDANTDADVDATNAALVGVRSGDTVSLVTSGASGSFADKHVGTNKTVQVSGLTLSGADADNYSLTQPTATADITAKNLSISGAVANSKTYDGNTSATVNWTGASLVGVVGTENVGLDSSGYSASFANKNVGTGKVVSVSGVVLTGTDSGNYSLTQPSLAADITAKNLTISGAVASSKAYDGNPSATVSFAGASLIGVVSGDSVSIDASGYQASFIDKNVGTNKPVTVTGVVLDGAGAGNYTLSQPSGLTADITAKSLSVSFAAESKVYDGNTVAAIKSSPAPSLLGVVSGDTVLLDGTNASASFANKNVGTGKTVTASGFAKSGADAGNYVFASPQGTTTADISAKELSVSFAANDKVYDGSAVAAIKASPVPSLVGVVSGDTVLLDGSGASASFANKNVGTAKTVTASGFAKSGADAGNYVFASPQGTTTAEIMAKNLTIAGAVANSKTYDGDAVATVNWSVASLVGVVGGDAVSIDSSGYEASFADKNVGTSKPVTVTGVVLGGAGAGNYTVSQPSGLTADIIAKSLSVSFAAESKVYDGDAVAAIKASPVPSLVGVISGDMVTLDGSGASASFANKNVGTAKTVTASGFAKSGADAANYVFANPQGATTADITAKSLSVSFAAESKVYDGNTVAAIKSSPAPSLLGVVSGDTVLLDGTNASASFANKNVGTGKTVTALGFAKSGADAGNYVFASPQGTTTANISAKELSVSFAANDKVYDGTAVATIKASPAPSLLGVVSGDTVLLDGTNASASFANKNVGTGKTVTATGFAKGGADAGNYVFASPQGTTTAEITAKNLTIAGAVANSKTYDSNASATVSFAAASLVGVVGSDAVSVVSSGYEASFADKNVGTNKPVTVTGVVLGGAGAGNYTVSQPSGLTANITSKSLSVSFAAESKVYDGGVGAAIKSSPGASLVGVVTGDTVVLDGSSASASFANKNVGTGKTVTASGFAKSGADAGNYVFTSPQGTTTADITRAPLKVTAVTDNKVYDGTKSSSGVPTVSGLQGADTVTAKAQEFQSKNAMGTNGSTLMVTGYVVNDANSGGNYEVSTETAPGTITKAALTISAVTQTKAYDGTTASTGTPTVSGLKSGDTVTGLAQAFQSKDAMGTNGSTLVVTGYTVNDGDSGGNYTVNTPTASGTITKGTLTVGPSPKTPSRQYSDPNPQLSPSYTGFANGETDAVLGTKPTCSTTATTTSAPASYPITCSGGIDSNYSFSYQGGTLTVTKEDALAAFSGSTYYSSPTAGGSVTATLTAVITDTADGSGGDIRNAKVTFVNRDAGGSAFAGCSNLSVGVVTIGDTTVGTATCNTTLTAGTSQTAANLYTVGIVVNNWYTRNDADDNTVVTVAQSVAGSITGGGFLVNELSGGQYAGELGRKTNFGFNVRLDKNGAPKGQINTIVRRNGRVYQIKGNAMTSLTTKVCGTGSSAACPGTATFNGKANIQDITNPLAAISVDGNAALQVTMTDKGEPGSSDTIGITLWDKNGGLWFSSRWDLSVSSSTIEQLLKGGNLVAR